MDLPDLGIYDHIRVAVIFAAALVGTVLLAWASSRDMRSRS